MSWQPVGQAVTKITTILSFCSHLGARLPRGERAAFQRRETTATAWQPGLLRRGGQHVIVRASYLEIGVGERVGRGLSLP